MHFQGFVSPLNCGKILFTTCLSQESCRSPSGALLLCCRSSWLALSLACAHAFLPSIDFPQRCAHSSCHVCKLSTLLLPHASFQLLTLFSMGGNIHFPSETPLYRKGMNWLLGIEQLKRPTSYPLGRKTHVYFLVSQLLVPDNIELLDLANKNTGNLNI